MERALTHIVAIGVLNKRQRIVGDLVDQLNALTIRSVIDTTLQNAAAVPVSSNFYAVSSDGVVDEL